MFVLFQENALKELREEKQAEVDTLSTTKPNSQDMDDFGIVGKQHS